MWGVPKKLLSQKFDHLLPDVMQIAVHETPHKYTAHNDRT